MRFFPTAALAITLLGIPSSALAQELPQIKALWQQTLEAVSQGDEHTAEALFGDFNEKVRAYLVSHHRTWEIEYLIGSLNCQFRNTRESGRKLLEDALQNSRGLNNAGEEEIRGQIAACIAPTPAPTANGMRDNHSSIPRDIADANTHFQNPGVHGDMKSGYDVEDEYEPAFAISPMPASELLKRRVSVSDPQRALSSALSSLPAGATGVIVKNLAVTTVGSRQSAAIGIGKCLQRYMPPLNEQFHIVPSAFMVTIYTANSTWQVHEFAGRLHGLHLPEGAVAYSVPEDMSLTAMGSTKRCGSMAHELVHLLIKGSFPVSPAWLEEGLASEIAVAEPRSDHFTFSWSWRDDSLTHIFKLRPSVAGLLETPWMQFAAADRSDIGRAAAVQAMAAVFIRFLDSKRILPSVYFAVRDQHFSPDLSKYRSYREILTGTLGKDIDQIDADFVNWFAEESREHCGQHIEGQRGNCNQVVAAFKPN